MKKKIKVSYTLSPDLVAKMTDAADKRGLSKSVFIQLAIEKYLEEGENSNIVKVKTSKK